MNRIRYMLHNLRDTRIAVAFPLLAAATLLACHAAPKDSAALAPANAPDPPRYFLGFDRNDYPGDVAMKLLRKDFAFAGFWLSPPPGEKSSSWSGKHELLHSLGYGFLPLYLGPDSARLKSAGGAKRQGASDAKKAAFAAATEGFAAGSIIFLDIEEGGRLTPEYHAYLKAWSEELRRASFRPGAYCSGMPVREGRSVVITTADDIASDPDAADFTFWIYNDQCPPSPGCVFPSEPPNPAKSGIANAAVWQFAQSPRRKEYTARCLAKYAPDGNCYAPSDAKHAWFLDVNSATSADPSAPNPRR
jgi:hypothetical protein